MARVALMIFALAMTISAWDWKKVVIAQIVSATLFRCVSAQPCSSSCQNEQVFVHSKSLGLTPQIALEEFISMQNALVVACATAPLASANALRDMKAKLASELFARMTALATESVPTSGT